MQEYKGIKSGKILLILKRCKIPADTCANRSEVEGGGWGGEVVEEDPNPGTLNL